MKQATQLTPIQAMFRAAESHPPSDRARLIHWGKKYQAATGVKPQVLKELEGQQETKLLPSCNAVATNINVVKIPRRKKQLGIANPPTFTGPGAAA